MKQCLQKILAYRYTPFILYIITMVCMHMVINPNSGDDLYYRAILDSYSWSEYIAMRYAEWSSRVVIDGLTVFVVQLPLLWKILNIAAWVGIAWLITRFFCPDAPAKVNWYVALMMVSFPIETMATAGWIATTMNYLWCVSLGLVACIPLADAVQNRKTAWYWYPLAIVAYLYAANQEQMCAVLIAVYLLVGGYLGWRERRCLSRVVAGVLLGFGSLAVIVTCPGVSVRYEQEIGRWFPGFAELSLLQKAELGYSHTMYTFAMGTNPIFFLFCATLMLAVFMKSRCWVRRCVAAFPFAVASLVGVLGGVLGKLVPSVAALRGAMTQTGTGFTLTAPETWGPVLFVSLVGVCIMLGLWFVFGHTLQTLWSIALLLLGLATGCVMGFSPTIWASAGRTEIFMYMAFIAVGTMLFGWICRQKWDKRVWTAVLLCMIAQIGVIGIYYVQTLILYWADFQEMLQH